MMLLASLLLALVTTASPATRDELRGRVVDSATSRPLAGALVAVDGAAHATTDAAGRFSLDVTPGRHTVVVQRPGYRRLERAVSVAGVAELELRVTPECIDC